jgi:hypothetical protein
VQGDDFVADDVVAWCEVAGDSKGCREVGGDEGVGDLSIPKYIVVVVFEMKGWGIGTQVIGEVAMIAD